MMALGDPCDRIVQNPAGIETHKLRNTELDNPHLITSMAMVRTIFNSSSKGIERPFSGFCWHQAQNVAQVYMQVK